MNNNKLSGRLKILNAANRYYPDGYMANFFDTKTGKEIPDEDGHNGYCGDTLALFLVREAADLGNGPIIMNVDGMIDRIDKAIRDLEAAKRGLLEL